MTGALRRPFQIVTAETYDGLKTLVDPLTGRRVALEDVAAMLRTATRAGN
jgi:hypothetical protein